MPVYFRKNASFTPSSLANPADDDDEENEEDYIQDPDLVRDGLPQPFRMINKLVGRILEDSWDIIHSQQDERLKDATRVRAPQYECGIQMKNHGNACTMAGTQDGKYIVVGQTDGLAVVAAHNQETVAVWKDDKLELGTIHLSNLDENTYVISTVDDMGIGRLFAFCEEQIFLLRTFSEQEGDKKVLVSKCEASPCADYIGVCLENASSQESWLEVHKVPKDVWLKEVSSASKTAARRDVTKPSTPQVDESRAGSVVLSEPAEAEEPTVASTQDVDQQSVSMRSMTGSTTPRDERSSHKFSATSLVLRVRPQPPVTGTQYSSPQQLAKTIDNTGEVMGTGSNHLISTQHLELRQAMFEQLHQQLLQYKPAEDGNNNMQPLPQASFHFLSAGRMLPQGLDHTTLTPTGVPTTLCVWWSGQTQVMQYSLVKTAKDVEHKPDIVWPLSSVVVASAVTPCTSLLALALQNNNVVVWDKYTGTPRRVAHISDEAPITSVNFLDPAITSQAGDTYPPYSLGTQSQIMVVCGTGHVYIVGCGVNDLSEPQSINLDIENETERPTLVQTVPGIPQLILTCRQNGQIFLQDLKANGRQLCQVTLPQSHDLTSPWQPVVAVGANGQMLYMKGTSSENPQEPAAVETEEEGSVAVETPETSLFVFQLRSFPTLDKYRADPERPPVPYVIHTTVQDRADALFRHRISRQTERQARLQSNWSHLKDELTIIEQRKEAHQRRTNKASFPCPRH